MTSVLTIIDSFFPRVKVHIPGYQYCETGIKFTERYGRGDPCSNPLDKACKEYDNAFELE